MRTLKNTSKLAVCFIAFVVLFDDFHRLYRPRSLYEAVLVFDNYYKNITVVSLVSQSSSLARIDTREHQQQNNNHAVDNSSFVTTTTSSDSNDNESLRKGNTVTVNVPRPLQVLREYQEQHSDRVLWEEYNLKMMGSPVPDKTNGHNNNNNIKDRRFAVAYYSCPRRAGNFLHYFFNAVTWSIIHNRTVLWTFFRLHEKSSTIDECEAS